MYTARMLYELHDRNYIFNDDLICIYNLRPNSSTIVQNLSTEHHGLNIFPNPANEFIEVQAVSRIDKNVYEGTMEIELLDLHGRIVIFHKLEKFNESYRLPIHSVQPGVYILRIRSDKVELVNRKWVIQR